ncbi:hypothetical protein [Tepidibacillus marianensis]|uniref:hypothetical protein n=1 Tax=Tepidibacillus marianensis TaxID=3131995 RepID=UPI0030D2ADE7
MKSKWSILYGFLILAILLGGIGVAKAAGVWSVSGKIHSDGSKIAVIGTDVDEIKGWMKLEDVIKAYNLDKGQLYKDFNLPADFPVIIELKDAGAETDEALSPSTIRDYITKKQQEQK